MVLRDARGSPGSRGPRDVKSARATRRTGAAPRGGPGRRLARAHLPDQGDVVMQIGFVGLGKMGSNMVERLTRKADLEVVAHDRDPAVVRAVAEFGASGAASLEELIDRLAPPRLVWLMIPAGRPTQDTVDRLASLLEPGDTVVDGGNSKWTDDKRRADQLAQKGLDYVDVGHERRRVGTRGGLLPDGRRAARCGRPPRSGTRRARPTAGRRARGGLGPPGADRRRALREDGAQRDRVRAHAGLRRGLRALRQVGVRARPGEERAPLDAGLGRALV